MQGKAVVGERTRPGHVRTVRTFKERPHMEGPSDMRACQRQARHGIKIRRGEAHWESLVWGANRQHKDEDKAAGGYSNDSLIIAAWVYKRFCTKYKHDYVCTLCICSLQNIRRVSQCNSTMLVLEMKNVLLALPRLE